MIKRTCLVLAFILATLLGVVIGSNSYAGEDPAFAAVAGVRFGGQNGESAQSLYVGGKFHLLRVATDGSGNYTVFNFLTPGINFHSDKKFSFSVAPLTVNTRYGITFGIDLFPLTKGAFSSTGVQNGLVGAFLGWTF